jgi:hypothetical protein
VCSVQVTLSPGAASSMVRESTQMDAKDLGRWTRFAAKGGIGRCTAIADCVAMGNDDLMFLAGDEIVVLMQLPEDDLYLVRPLHPTLSRTTPFA